MKKIANLDIATVLKTMVRNQPDDSLTPQSIAKMERKLESLNTDDYFGFEDVDSQIEELSKKINADKTRLQMLKAGFPLLDHSFLGWRRADGTPAFTIFSLFSKTFTMYAEPRHSSVDDINDVSWEIYPTLPEALEARYTGALISLGKLSSDKYESERITLEAEFSGIVPAEVRKVMNKALKSYYFNDLFIICESPSPWPTKKVSRSLIGDPLVVGWDYDSESLYLVASFDTISFKEYIQGSKK